MAAYYWFQTLYNGYEPDNTIKIRAEKNGDTYQPFELSGYLTFKDGSSFVYIRREETNKFIWKNDDRTGTASTFEEAALNMPALVTSPDHYENSEIFEE